MYINTDNIIFEKVWDDDLSSCQSGIYEIKVTAYNEFVKLDNFNFYMDFKITKELSKLINQFIQDNETINFENSNSVNNHENMLIEIKPSDSHGHVMVELRVENESSNDKNLAEFLIETEIGLLENFGKNILDLVNAEIGYKVSLNKEI